MNKREVVKDALAFRPVQYVPWAWDLMIESDENLNAHLGVDDSQGFFAVAGGKSPKPFRLEKPLKRLPKRRIVVGDQ